MTIGAALMSAAVVLSCSAIAHSIEIPIEGGLSNNAAASDVKSSNSTSGIAYVDIEMIFNEHPMTQRLKGEFEAAVEKKKKELSDMEKSLKDFNGVMVSSAAEVTKLQDEIEQV